MKVIARCFGLWLLSPLLAWGEPEDVSVGQANALIPLKIRKTERADRMTSAPSASTALAAQEATKEVEWESERLSDQTLTLLKKLLKNPNEGNQVLAESFRGEAPVPPQLALSKTTPSGWELWKNEEKETALDRSEFLKALDDRMMVAVRLKSIGIEVAESKVQSQLFAEYASEGRSATAYWDCEWLKSKDTLLLVSLSVRDYQELRGQPQPMFVDQTAAVLGSTAHYPSQVQRGIADWAKDLSKFSDLVLTGHQGLAVGDVDGDGREDLFVCDGGGLPNRLYRQLADGSAEDISAQAGLDWFEDSRSALFVDFDNDGDQDLVVATIGIVAFAENDGTGKFTLQGGFPGAQYPFSMCAADYNLDGKIDLYVCVYGQGDNASGGRGFATHSPVPFEDARNGGRNVLLENLGSFAFADVTDKVGLNQSNDRWSFAASWGDYDRDGDSDLYVANDFGKNTFYKNEAGRFSEVSVELGVEDLAAGMSVSWGDFNRDGQFDLYVGNMFSAAGERIATKPEFASGRSELALTGLQRMARGNSLFSASAEGFQEQSGPLGAAMGRWAWSSGFVDLDNDGWEDLVIANGFLTGWQNKKDL